MDFKEIFLGAVGLCAVVMIATGAGVKELGLDKLGGGLGLSGGGGSGAYNLSYNMRQRSVDQLLNWDLSHAKLQPPGIATANGYALISEVAKSHPGATEQIPTSIVEVAAEDCTARPPQPTEMIVNVYGAGGYFPSGIGVVSDTHLEGRAAKWIEKFYKDMQETPRLLGYERHQTMDVIDVYLTETAAPLYLILQSRGGDTLFNLQVAEGVEIAQVAVVSARPVGVANLPDGTALDYIGSGCGYAMWRMPKAQWDFVQNTRNGIGDEALLDEHYQNAGVYSDWFAGVFGIGAEQGQVGYGKQSYMLAGPLPAPEALMDYTPVGVVHLMGGGTILSGSFDERKAQYRTLVEDVLAEATGTGLETFLTNAPMLRADAAVNGGDQ